MRKRSLLALALALALLAGAEPPAEGPLFRPGLAPLRPGEDIDGGALVDIDTVRPIPQAFLEKGFVRDGTDLSVGTLDAVAFEEFLIQAHYTAQKAFEKAARRDLTYAQVFADP